MALAGAAIKDIRESTLISIVAGSWIMTTGTVREAAHGL